MQDHGLFQAICRVNRLDGEYKDYGYIIDYKDLFNSLNEAVKDYTTEAFGGFDPEDVGGLLKDRIKVAKEDLDSALESIRALCEPVNPPKDTVSFIEFFCGNPENSLDLKNSEQKRIMLYKLTSKLIRSYSNIAGDMDEAGYSKKDADKIQEEVRYYEQIRTEIKLASGDYVDLKAYEPAMRHLIDSYIDADASRTISAFDNLTLIDLIVKNGENAIKDLPASIKKDDKAVAEVIENNVRKLIIDEKPTNPKYYDNMSVLLDDLIRERKTKAINYERYLKKIVEFVKQLKNPSETSNYSKKLNTSAKRALYDNLDKNESLALGLHENITEYKPDGWRGNTLKEKKIKKIITNELEKVGKDDSKEVERVFELVKNQNEY
jgi:type I restriction enzyme R subunit